MPTTPQHSTPDDALAVSYADRVTALGVGIFTGIPTILWGGSGIGKTKVCQSIAGQLGAHQETVLLSASDTTDFSGMPTVNPQTGEVNYSATPWVKRVMDADRNGMASLVLWDEYSLGSPAVQGASLYPLLENKVGDTILPPETRHVAAANPADMSAGGFDLVPPAANRFLHLDWRMPSDVWIDGMLFGFPEVAIPDVSDEAIARAMGEVKVLVTSFIRARSDLLHVQPDTITHDNVAFPSPRTWENVIRLLAVAKAAGCNDMVINLLVLGSVGSAAGGEFLTYVENLDLPDPEAIIADPDSLGSLVDLRRGDKIFATCGSLMNALANKNDAQRWLAVGTALAIIAEAGKSDIAVVFGSPWIQQFRPKNAALSDARILTALGPVLTEMGALVKDK